MQKNAAAPDEIEIAGIPKKKPKTEKRPGEPIETLTPVKPIDNPDMMRV